MHRPSAFLFALVVACGGKGGTDEETEGSGSGTETTGGSESGSETGSESETQTETETESGGELNCGDAEDETACDQATNAEDGGGCTWMDIYELQQSGTGGCEFTETDRGKCVGTNGEDDGCNEGFVCDPSVDAYWTMVDADTWEMVWGKTCRGVPGFEQCANTDEFPCSCACSMP
jgi:hypothetical protein